MKKPFRTLALLSAAASVAGGIFFVTLEMASVVNGVARGASRLGADILVVPQGSDETAGPFLISGRPSLATLDRSVVDRVRAVAGIRAASPQYFFRSARTPCCAVADVLLAAFDPATDFTVTPWIAADGARPLHANAVLVGAALPLLPGDMITLYGTGLDVAATLEATGTDFIDRTVFLPFAAAYDIARRSQAGAGPKLVLSRDRISAVFVRVKAGTSPEKAAIFIEHAIPGVTALPASDIAGSLKKQLTLVSRTITGITAILWITSVLLIGIVFSLIVNERRREFGVLRALGATRGALFRMVMIEAALVCSAGGLAGLGISGAFLWGLGGRGTAVLGLPYRWPEPGFVAAAAGLCFVLVAASGIAAALYPVARALGRGADEMVSG